MIVGATMVVVAMAFYAITLSRLYSIGEARQGRAERALPDLLSGGMRDVQSEVRNRARRRRALMFESSDDVQIESARRDVLAALAVAAFAVLAWIPLGQSFERALATAADLSPLWVLALVVPALAAFLWLVDLTRALVAPSPRPLRITFGILGLVGSLAVVAVLSGFATSPR